MKNIFRTVVCTTIVAAGTLAAFAAPTTVTGVLTDSMCTKKHMMPGKTDADCVRACVKEGSKYAVATGDGKSYILQGDAKQLDALAGQVVTVTGDTQGNTLKVKTISAKK